MYFALFGIFLLFVYALHKIRKLEKKNKELEDFVDKTSKFVHGVATNIHTIVTEQTKAIDLISKYEQENKEEFELFRGDVARFILALNEHMTGFGKKDTRISPSAPPKKNDKNNKPN